MCTMASAIDSGVDTGNDSNDSSVQVQDKLSKMDLDNTSQSKSSSSNSETTSEENQDVFNQPHTSSEIAKMDSNPAVSLKYLQPASLMHGYESHKIFDSRRNYKCVIFNLCGSKDTRPIDGGGPLGTEYKGQDLVTKLHQRLPPLRIRKYINSGTYKIRNYSKLKEALKLCRAVCSNNTDAVQEMLSNGISPNCFDSFKRSPLHLAAAMGYVDMVKLLLDHGADPNAKDSIGNTPLHLAACTNHVGVITLLLKGGTRVTELDFAGHSPLQLAITKFNIMKRSVMPHPVLKEQVCQVILMLTEYMRRKEGPSIDPDLLNRFESLVRVSDSTEEVESNIQDLLSNLSLSSNS